jgi:hypothetical protein
MILRIDLIDTGILPFIFTDDEIDIGDIMIMAKYSY